MIIEPAHKLEHINEYYFSTKLKQIAQLVLKENQLLILELAIQIKRHQYKQLML
jgi:hypothetical protein